MIIQFIKDKIEEKRRRLDRFLIKLLNGNAFLDWGKDSYKITDKNCVNYVYFHPNMAMPGKGQEMNKLYKLGKYYAIFQKNSYSVDRSKDSTFYLYALTIIPDRNKPTSYMHQISIDAESEHSAPEENTLTITHPEGKIHLGSFTEPMTDENVLARFAELARTKLEYKGKLKFIENFVFIEPEDKK